MNSQSNGSIRGCLRSAVTAISVVVVMLAACTPQSSLPYQGERIRRLTTRLQEGDDAARLAAVEELEPIVDYCAQLRYMDLRNIRATQSRPLLTQALAIALRDPKSEVRVAAAKLVVPARPGSWISEDVLQDMPGLMQQLAEDEEPEVRLAGLHCYEYFLRCEDKVVPVLARLATDDDDVVRARAVEVLIGHVWCREIPASAQNAMCDAAPAILEYLRDYSSPSDLEPLAVGCCTLMRIRDHETQVALLTLLNTPEGVEGVSLWSTLGPDLDMETLLEGVVKFRDLLTHEDARLREAAIRLVSATEGTTPDSIPLIISAMRDPAGNVRGAAANAMIDAHSYDEAWGALEELLDDPEAQVRLQAIAAYRSKWVSATERGDLIGQLERIAEEDSAKEVRDAAAESVTFLRRQR